MILDLKNKYKNYFQGISNFVGYLVFSSSLLKNSSGTF